MQHHKIQKPVLIKTRVMTTNGNTPLQSEIKLLNTMIISIIKLNIHTLNPVKDKSVTALMISSLSTSLN
jgi:hypothetical protein